jgi:chromosome segregation ATPase
MPSTVITAEARILGTDQTGGAFASVQAKVDALTKKFGQVGKAAAISAEIEKLNAALAKTQNQLAGVQKLQTAEDKLARLATRNAQQKAIAEEQASARTAAAAQRAAAAYYKQLDAVNALKRNLEGAGVAVNKLASEEARLRGAIDQTSGAIGRQNRALAAGGRARSGTCPPAASAGPAARAVRAWGGSHRGAHPRKRDGSADRGGCFRYGRGRP